MIRPPTPRGKLRRRKRLGSRWLRGSPPDAAAGRFARRSAAARGAGCTMASWSPRAESPEAARPAGSRRAGPVTPKAPRRNQKGERRWRRATTWKVPTAMVLSTFSMRT